MDSTLMTQGKAHSLALDLAGVNFDADFVRQHPEQALNALTRARTGDTPTSLAVVARAFENTLAVLSEGPDGIQKARGYLREHVTPQLQAQIQGRQGDRLTVGLQVVEPAVILAALEIDLVDSRDGKPDKDGEHSVPPAPDIASAAFYLLVWADSLKERDDWHELLEMQMSGGYTLGMLLVAGVIYDRREDANFALEMLRADHLEWEPDDLPSFSKLDAATARKRLRELRQSLAQETTDDALSAQRQAADDAATNLEDDLGIM